MADEHPNATLLRKLYGGEWDSFLKNVAPDYQVHIPGKSNVAGHYPGVEGHERHRKVMQAIAGNTMKLRTLGTFIADDTWGLVPSRVTASREGNSFDLQGFGLWRFRDGKFTDHWAITDDQVAWDSFFTTK